MYLVDGVETRHDETNSKKLRVITIPVTVSAEEIEIVTSLGQDVGVDIPFMQRNEKLISEFPPLQQTKYGIPIEDVRCKDSLELVFKSAEGSRMRKT